MRTFFSSIVTTILITLTGCSDDAAAPSSTIGSLDAIAQDYVILTLEIGQHEPGYVDAYYGPQAWAEDARNNLRNTAELATAAAELYQQLDQLQSAALDADSRQRRAYLQAHVSAAQARLRMIDGERLPFADEALALFGVRPALQALSAFDPAMMRIDALIPGTAPLAERVANFRARYTIPPERLDVVMQAAIAECRASTVQHITLPQNERFTLEFVTDKSWSGYNYYQGDANSLIQINTDLPIYIDRAVDLGCHEGYPGHHVYNALLERTFVQNRGWVEMSIFPLYSPMALVAEGSANFGIDLAFPDEEQLLFEKEVLYPLAGLDPATADALAELLELTRELEQAQYTIADAWLAGSIDRSEALALLQQYGLTTPERAEQRLRFIDTYRSYIINYGLGRDMVQAWIERQGENRWAAMEQLLSSQLLPVDLAE